MAADATTNPPDGPDGPDEDNDDDDDGKGSLGGKIKEKLGWLTADRQLEAEGKLQQSDAAGLGAETDGDDDDTAAEAADRAELEVRSGYDELHPDAEPG